MHTWTCGHTLSHTYVLFSFILQCNNRSQIQKSAGFYRKQSVCTKQKRKDIEGCDELTYSVRGKIKAVEKCIGNWGQFSGPLCHVQHTVTSSRWVFENKANGIPASLLFFFLLWRSQGTGRNKEKACESSLAEKQSGRQREDEADSLWRRLLYCKIRASSASLSK